MRIRQVVVLRDLTSGVQSALEKNQRKVIYFYHRNPSCNFVLVEAKGETSGKTGAFLIVRRRLS